MRVVHRAATALACAALLSCSSGSPDAALRPEPEASSLPSTYLALGDSVAAGVGAADPSTGGYVPVLAARLSERLGCDRDRPPGCPLDVRNLAVAGATTGTLLRDQLPSALAVLEQAPDVRLVTVTVGGNDVFAPVVQSCARAVDGPPCRQAVGAALRAADAGVDRLLGALGAAAGPGTTIAVMTYYDSLPACRLAALSPLASQVLEGTGTSPGLNDLLRARAAEHGATAVDTADRLRVPGDFVGGLDCLHPNASGHARIAAAFLEEVGAQVLRR